MNLIRFRPVFAALSGLAVAACGGSTPTASEPTLPPAAAPAAAVATVPTNTPGCTLGLPKGTGPGVNCPRTSPKLMRLVEDSVTATRELSPVAYPLDDFGYRLTAEQLDAFFKTVVDRINASGQACAYRDGLELAVKSTNAESEQYKFWVTSGHMRLGDNAYRATCTPAWF